VNFNAPTDYCPKHEILRTKVLLGLLVTFVIFTSAFITQLYFIVCIGLRVHGLVEDDTLTQPRTSSGCNVNKILDRNLDEMYSSLSRLKGLAQGLGEEIDTQNEIIDRLNDKTDKAEFTILRQNKDMNKILKK
jgi:hypothetical protein